MNQRFEAAKQAVIDRKRSEKSPECECFEVAFYCEACVREIALKTAE